MVRWRDELRMAVLITDYPGFGKSKGVPTEAGCNAAGKSSAAGWSGAAWGCRRPWGRWPWPTVRWPRRSRL